MKKISILIFVLFSINISSVNSEPQSVVKWLMNEPLSLFSYGIHKLEAKLETFRDGKFIPIIKGHSIESLKIRKNMELFAQFVNYSYEDNRIEVNRQYSMIVNLPEDNELYVLMKYNIQQLCSDQLVNLRSLLFQYRTNRSNEVKQSFSGNVEEQYFSQAGYQVTSKPGELNDELEKIIWLQGKIDIFDEKSSRSIIQECQLQLMSTNTLFSKPEEVTE